MKLSLKILYLVISIFALLSRIISDVVRHYLNLTESMEARKRVLRRHLNPKIVSKKRFVDLAILCDRETVYPLS